MPGVAVTSLNDVLVATFKKAPRRKFQETQKYTDHPGVRNVFGNGREDVKGGTSFSTLIRRTTSNTMRTVRPYEVTSFQANDTLINIDTPWCFYQDKAVLDSKVVDLNSNDDGTQIVDIVKAIESDKVEGQTIRMERDVWLPPLSSTDTTTLRGIIGYWFAPLAAAASDTTGGFNGTTAVFRDTSTSTTIGGQDRSNVANERLRNFVGTWSGTVDPTLLSQMRRCMTRTNFNFIEGLEGEPVKASGKKFIYAGHNVCDALEEMVNQGPDDTNGDLIRFINPLVRGQKVMRVPVLDELFSYNPIVAVDHSKLFGIVLRGNWMKRTDPLRVDSTISGWSYETTANVHCTDIRGAGWLLHTVR